jgi:hypothetical protein
MKRRAKLEAKPKPPRKGRARRAPRRMKGLRRPQEIRAPSLVAPNTGCAKAATVSPVKVSRPRYVFFCVSATSPSKIAGRRMAWRPFHRLERAKA